MRLRPFRLAEANPPKIGQVLRRLHLRRSCRGDGHQGVLPGRGGTGRSRRRLGNRGVVAPVAADGRFELRVADAAQRRGCAEKALVNDHSVKSDGVKQMCAPVAIDDRDAHLRHDLGQTRIERLEQVRFTAFGGAGAGRFERQPGANRTRAHAQQHGHVVHIAAVTRFHSKARAGTDALARKLVVHCAESQGHRYGGMVTSGRAV